MATFYCVNAEFYDNGTVKVCKTERRINKKPASQYRRVYGMAALIIWLASEIEAVELAESIRLGTAGLDDLLIFYSDIKGLEAAA